AAAAVADAFTCGTVDEIIDKALEYIPESCDYRTVVNAVRDFHKKNPDDFRAARAFVDENFGAHLFPGYCHIIPNAGICILAMLYSGGDLGRAIEIAVMCGFDTDCNSSSIGTILGVWNGIEKVPERYRKPINDTVVLSSASGYLNMHDLPEAAKNIYNTACELYGYESEKVTAAAPGEIFMDFSLPGSTYGIELSEEAHHTIRNSEGCGTEGGRALELLIDGKHPKPVNMTFKAFYTADDFNDDQYSPVFSPRVYPGQTLEALVYVQPESEAQVSLKPWLNTVFNKTEYCGDVTELAAGKWQKIEFKVPSLSGDIIHDIGFEVAVKALVPEPQVKVHVYFDYIRVSGGYGCLFDLTRGIKEFDEPIPFSTTDCKTFFTRGMLYMASEELGLAFTGNYYAADQSIEAVTDIDSGSTAGFILRAQGLRRFYSLGLDKGRAVIKLHFNGEVTELASADAAEFAPNCNMIARAEDDKLSLYINGEAVVQAADNTLTYGMVGMFAEKSQAGFENIAIIGNI
ncbi:MAG: ADP-ribosylglycohydrolase family protein, partial [Parasporobacterium sp.]|nr:ADP-ribosylglycohydrolase family protein [Parasporobacterium sp.]